MGSPDICPSRGRALPPTILVVRTDARYLIQPQMRHARIFTKRASAVTPQYPISSRTIRDAGGEEFTMNARKYQNYTFLLFFISAGTSAGKLPRS